MPHLPASPNARNRSVVLFGQVLENGHRLVELVLPQVDQRELLLRAA